MARFMTLEAVAEELDISMDQAYALTRCGALPAIKVGGRGQWRVEREQLEEYIQRMYAQTRELIASTRPGPVEVEFYDYGNGSPA